MRRLTFAILPAALTLAACGGQTPERGDDEREAEGEVLGGTISDQMLPLDQLQSQSPVLRDRPSGGAGEDDAAEGEEENGEDGASAPPDAPAEPSEQQD